ncbi:Uck2 [Phodopus roborovskii]|uniref:Uck2 protein n=1 Tax=Phodopus roborovskii TaxID=109678 RepID=A0AAU9ZBJ2_PHORO|nr:Uck2 [Phodopus roborovskii]
MAGDSEQTLQNHQQPNGGEPFLIGVSGGTASGKPISPWPLLHFDFFFRIFPPGLEYFRPAAQTQRCVL